MTLRRNLIVGAVAVVALALVVAIVAASGGDDGETAGSSLRETGSPEVAGTPLPAFDATSPQDPAVGQPVPSVRGQTFAGADVTIDSAGPGVILFVAHWCSHCQEEVPRLSEWFAAGGGEGLRWATVSTSADERQPNWPPSAWLARERYDRPVLADDEAGTVASAFGLSAFPYWVFVDADGNVAGRATGQLSVEQLEQVADTLT